MAKNTNYNFNYFLNQLLVGMF